MPTRISAGVGDHPCFITMIPIDCKITNFPYTCRSFMPELAPWLLILAGFKKPVNHGCH